MLISQISSKDCKDSIRDNLMLISQISSKDCEDSIRDNFLLVSQISSKDGERWQVADSALVNALALTAEIVPGLSETELNAAPIKLGPYTGE